MLEGFVNSRYGSILLVLEEGDVVIDYSVRIC